MSESPKKGPRPLVDLLPEPLKAPGRAIQRLFDGMEGAADADSAILYQHSVLCQTCLPYRDPGDDVRLWSAQERLRAARGCRRAGPSTARATTSSMSGLPFGPKPRLVLYHLNAEALRTQSPVIELEDSLTAFVKRTLGLDTGGRNIRTVKDQLTRLSAADFRIGTSRRTAAR